MKCKKIITREVEITIVVPYTKTFRVTKEVDWDEEVMKNEEMDDRVYFDCTFSEQFEEEAKDLLDKHLNSDFIGSDLDWEEMEYTDVELLEEDQTLN